MEAPETIWRARAQDHGHANPRHYRLTSTVEISTVFLNLKQKKGPFWINEVNSSANINTRVPATAFCLPSSALASTDSTA